MVFHCNQSAPQQLYLNHVPPICNTQPISQSQPPARSFNHHKYTTHHHGAHLCPHSQSSMASITNPFTSPSSTHLCLTNPTKQLCHPVPSPLHHPSFSINQTANP
ncbi:hypothetical protein M0R45_029553 [Rubus argutus]|uniref:Uncharacterized protein n=1 Tax=Rubus argutus TaxID=59490 RepID=A0AAW1W8G8_RUBAR